MEKIKVGQFRELAKKVTKTIKFNELELEINTYLPIEKKMELINEILEIVFKIKRDDETNQVWMHTMYEDEYMVELLKAYVVAQNYIVNVTLPKNSLVEVYDIMISSGLYAKIKEDFYDVNSFENLLYSKIFEFKANECDNTGNANKLLNRLTDFMDIYEAQLKANVRELELKNDQTEKFINAMPDDINSLDLDVDRMLKQAEKLSQLENFDVIKKI